MDKEQLKKRAKRFFIAAIVIGMIMFVVSGVHWLFLIPAILFFVIAFLVFKDIRELDEEEDNVQEVVTDNLETKQINTEVKMEMNNEEKALILEVLSKDEELNVFLKVTNGQAKFALFERLRAELEAKAEKKPKQEKGKAEAEKDSKGEDEDIVVED
uniref:Uncharacterized protein n=1 Tax=viral metagenome TaxID=1070528 RepID=A0A6H1ZJN8_9ZZZZ